jgi:hypothetical protein
MEHLTNKSDNRGDSFATSLSVQPGNFSGQIRWPVTGAHLKEVILMKTPNTHHVFERKASQQDTKRLLCHVIRLECVVDGLP